MSRFLTSTRGPQQNSRGGSNQSNHNRAQNINTVTICVSGYDRNWSYKEFQSYINSLFKAKWISSSFSPNSDIATIDVVYSIANKMIGAINRDSKIRAWIQENVARSNNVDQNWTAVLNQRFNPTNDFLNLSNLTQDLRNFSISNTTHIQNLTTALEKFTYAKIIDLSNNNITSLRLLSGLLSSFPALHSLSLNNNKLNTPSTLTILSSAIPNLQHLILTNNPFLTKIQDPNLLSLALKSLFPKLISINDLSVPPQVMPLPILLTNQLPPSIGNFQSPDEMAANATLQVQCLLRCLDNRLPSLIQFFAPSAVLSITTAEGDASLDTSRNLFSKLTLPNNPYPPSTNYRNTTSSVNYDHRRNNPLIRGNQKIIECFSQMPTCFHDVDGLTFSTVRTSIGILVHASCNYLDVKGKYIREVDISCVIINNVIHTCNYHLCASTSKYSQSTLPSHGPLDDMGRLLDPGPASPMPMSGGVNLNDPVIMQQLMSFNPEQQQLIKNVLIQVNCSIPYAVQGLQHCQGNVEQTILLLRQNPEKK